MANFHTYTTPISARDVQGQVAAIYVQLKRDLGSVAVTVSRRNRCSWCIDIHSMMLEAAGRPMARTAIADGQVESIADPALRAIVTWANQPLLDQPPVAFAAAPELIGTAVTFHYPNRIVAPPKERV